MKTEEQARTKWCPQVRMLPVDGEGEVVFNLPSFNRRGDPDGSSKSFGKCVASNCMWWRSRVETCNTTVGKPPEPDRDGVPWVEHNDPYHVITEAEMRQSWRREGGWCGIAGAD